MDDLENYYATIYFDPVLEYIEQLSFGVYEWVVLFGVLFLALEVLNDAVTRQFNKKSAGETISSLVTQIPYYFSETFVFTGFVFLYFFIWDVTPWKMNPAGEYWPWMLLGAIIAADFIYYWEHRIMHRVRLLWLAHSVHHSSPMINTATAFRFSMFDPFISGAFHLPLVLCGVHPVYVFAGEIIVQAYQFWIHNEMTRKLGPLEWVLNTPSHHRVHHGSDKKYIDKNYGGILIIWDRIFGTFVAEQERPTYGLTTPINTINPFKVQFYEFPKLFRDIAGARSIGHAVKYIFKPPGWKPE